MMKAGGKRRTKKSDLPKILKALGTIARILWAVIAFALSVIVTLDRIAWKLRIRAYAVHKYKK